MMINSNHPLSCYFGWLHIVCGCCIMQFVVFRSGDKIFPRKLWWRQSFDAFVPQSITLSSTMKNDQMNFCCKSGRQWHFLCCYASRSLRWPPSNNYLWSVHLISAPKWYFLSFVRILSLKSRTMVSSSPNHTKIINIIILSTNSELYWLHRRSCSSEKRKRDGEKFELQLMLYLFKFIPQSKYQQGAHWMEWKNWEFHVILLML